MNPEPKLLVDTNVWLDAFLAKRHGHQPAHNLMDFAARNNISLLYAAVSPKDIFFIASSTLKRELRETEENPGEGAYQAISQIVWQYIEHMAIIGTAVGCDESDLWLARKYRSIHPDLEDNLIVAAAQRASADYLVTNDEKLILHSPVATLSPTDALALLQQAL